MFAHHCSACAQRQLIFPSQITEMENTERGIVVHFACWCGAPQTMVTGRRAAAAHGEPVPATAA